MVKLVLLLLFPVLTNAQLILGIKRSPAPMDFSAWDYKREIEIDNSGSNKTTSNAQVKIELTDANFDFSHAEPDGSDLRFATTTNIALDYYIEFYNSLSEYAIIWVEVRTLTAASENTILLYYGNSAVTSASSFDATMRRYQKNSNTTHLYRFSEGIGSTLSGVVGSAATLNGGYTWSAGDIWGGNGNKVALNGSSGYISIPGMTTVPDFGSIHLSFDLHDINREQIFLSKRFNGSNSFAVGINSSNRIFLAMQNSTVNITNTGDSIYSNDRRIELTFTWNHNFLLVYVNGAQQCYYLYRPRDWNSGFSSSNNIIIGADGRNGTNTSFAEITLSEIAIENQQTKFYYAKALHEKRKFYELDEGSKWAASKGLTEDDYFIVGNPVTGDFYAEPELFYWPDIDPAKPYHMYFSSSEGGNYGTILRKAATVDGLKSASNVLVNGKGLNVARSSYHSIFKDADDVIYLYYVNGHGPGYPLSVAKSTDGVNFTDHQTAYNTPTNPNFGWNGLYNTSVIKSGSTYYMMLEQDNSDDYPSIFDCGVLTSSNPMGPFTELGSNPKESLRYADGCFTAPTIIPYQVHSTWQVWMCSSLKYVGTTSLPAELFRYTTNDFNTFTKVYKEPVVRLENALEGDQAGDQTVLEAEGKCTMLYNAATNLGTPVPNYQIMKVEFEGTLSQLTKDLSLTVGIEQLN